MKVNNDDKHLLILGSPRSGTTLLTAMLGCHSKIAILSENYPCTEFKVVGKQIKGNKLCIPNQIELKHGLLTKVIDILVTLYQRVGNLIKNILNMRTPIARGRKARLSIRDYENVASNLVIIGIIRSPKDVVSSIYKRGQQSKRTAEYRWRRAIEVLYELYCDRSESTDLLIVHYNQLVEKPELVMKRCLNILDCEYEDSVLTGYLHTPQYKGRKGIDKNKISQLL